jgi:hypothetical protein
MSLFGPPDVRSLKAKGDVRGLCKALTYQSRSVNDQSAHVRWAAAEALESLGVPGLQERAQSRRLLSEFGKQA